MPVVFVIPAPLRELAGERRQVRVAGAPHSVSEALTLLWRECPALRDRIITELGEVRPHVNIFVDGESIHHSGELATTVRASSEVVIMPALSGG
jgi:molybdopterin synthase sulfur carrier subunit